MIRNQHTRGIDMYNRDARMIQDYVRHGGSDAFIHVGQFVLLTIRQPLHRVAADLAAVRDGDRRPLWGSKGAGFDYLAANGATLYTDVMALEGDADAQLARVADVPGLGLVKAGFVLQLAFGVSGCLDSHNINRLGLDTKVLKLAKSASAKLRAKKAAAYNALCQQLGGTEVLWDDWCDYAYAHGQGNASRYVDGDDVSKEHVRALGLAA